MEALVDQPDRLDIEGDAGSDGPLYPVIGATTGRFAVARN